MGCERIGMYGTVRDEMILDETSWNEVKLKRGFNSANFTTANKDFFI